MRYKAGWFIPQQVLALTHFASEVTPDEFIEITEIFRSCLQEVDGRFHLIIDNRNIASEQVGSLETILQFMPQLQSLPLGWIVMVLSHRVQANTITRDVEQVGDVHLKYVETLEAAFDTLQAVDTTLDWELQISDFFAEAANT